MADVLLSGVISAEGWVRKSIPMELDHEGPGPRSAGAFPRRADSGADSIVCVTPRVLCILGYSSFQPRSGQEKQVIEIGAR